MRDGAIPYNPNLLYITDQRASGNCIDTHSLHQPSILTWLFKNEGTGDFKILALLHADGVVAQKLAWSLGSLVLSLVFENLKSPLGVWKS